MKIKLLKTTIVNFCDDRGGVVIAADDTADVPTPEANQLIARKLATAVETAKKAEKKAVEQ